MINTQLTKLNKIFKEIKYNYVSKSLVIIILNLLTSLFEITGLATIIPIIDILLNPSGVDGKYDKVFNFLSIEIKSVDEIVLYLILFLIIISILKFIFVIINTYYSNYIIKELIQSLRR